jgi:iron(III) transport system substrate-binding protein
MTRKHIRLRAVFVLTLSFLLSGCLPTQNSPDKELPQDFTATPPSTDITPSLTTRLPNEYFLPPYYSNKFYDTIEASKKEKGLIIYSNLGEDNWKPAIDAFSERYPWIQVTPVTLGANEVFDRYNTEVADSARTADIIITYSPDGWLTFANAGQINPYISEEDLYVPAWAKLAPGLYTIASDPMLILYNKDKITNPPQSMADIANLATDSSTADTIHITSYNVDQNLTGLAITWSWIKQLGNTGWEILGKIGRTKPDFKTSASSIISSVQSGESQVAYFVSPVSFLSQLNPQSNLGWAYLKDGQPILMRSAAITKSAESPNSAKLMINFLLSQEGQIALAMGGMTPYRQDIADVDLFNPVDGVQHHIHLDQVIDAVGLDKLIFINLDPEINDMDRRNQLIEKWLKTMNR